MREDGARKVSFIAACPSPPACPSSSVVVWNGTRSPTGLAVHQKVKETPCQLPGGSAELSVHHCVLTRRVGVPAHLQMLINTREAFSSDSVCCPLKGDAHLSKGNALSGKTPVSGKAIRSCQHGFSEGKSCLTNPIASYHKTTTWMDGGTAVDFVYLDFRKACETVSHHICWINSGNVDWKSG